MLLLLLLALLKNFIIFAAPMVDSASYLLSFLSLRGILP